MQKAGKCTSFYRKNNVWVMYGSLFFHCFRLCTSLPTRLAVCKQLESVQASIEKNNVWVMYGSLFFRLCTCVCLSLLSVLYFLH